MREVMEVKCYDTITKEYITVEVSETVATYYKRSYWREDMQQRRYNSRVLCVDALDQGVSDYVLKSECNVELEVISEYDKEIVKVALNKLTDEQRKIVRLVYYNGRTLSSIARELEVSPSYMSKRVKGIYKKMREHLEDIY